MLPRILEQEWMDSERDAREYDAMDHAAVNAQFVTDLLTALADWSLKRPLHAAASPFHVLDLGAGTAQIPIELTRRSADIHVTAVDAAENMLIYARNNIAKAGLAGRIDVLRADAKRLPFDPASFPIVISNSIVHHIAEPKAVLAEAIRVCAPRGLLCHRDLARPGEEAEIDHLVATYAAGATQYQRKLFADSLRAALTIEEARELVGASGYAGDTVQRTSDRHWTMVAVKHGDS